MAISAERTPGAPALAAYRRIALAREGRMRGACLAFDDSLVTRASRLGRRLPTRVLIVDDDPASRTLCAMNLEFEGLVVLQATDGRRGLEQARSERPDLVLTDVTMRGLNGFQLAESLRCDERTRRIPLVFISAETASANVARARELGALAYVTKPCDFSALALLVASVAVRVGGPLPSQHDRSRADRTPNRLADSPPMSLIVISPSGESTERRPHFHLGPDLDRAGRSRPGRVRL